MRHFGKLLTGTLGLGLLAAVFGLLPSGPAGAKDPKPVTVGTPTREPVPEQGREKVAALDDCDPNDPTWAPTGGCTLEEGDVNRNEFNALVGSPLSLATVGHPAWRMDPSYLKIEPNETVRVRNRGGRGHTFTEVAAFGGGFVPPLNLGLTPAPECINPAVVGPTQLQPGGKLQVRDLGVGDHRFQCCIHPWMRTVIKVKPEE